MATPTEDPCAFSGPEDYDITWHIASIFILVVASLLGSVTPVAYSLYHQHKRKHACSLHYHHVDDLPEDDTLSATSQSPMRPPSPDSLHAHHPTQSLWIRMGVLFGAGTILATGCIHMFVPATLQLNHPCLASLNKNYSGYSGLFAMLSMLLMQAIQYTVTVVYERWSLLPTRKNSAVALVPSSSPGRSSPVHVCHQTNGSCSSLDSCENRQCEPSVEVDCQDPQHHHHHHLPIHLFAGQETGELGKKYQKRITVALLELGIVAHSVIIGVALGVSQGSEFMALMIALCFHQFFEGLALGATIVEAEFKRGSVALLLTLVYGITTPLGIVLGIAIHSTYNPNSPEALLVQGIFDSISAGILIYTALVELLTPEITHNVPFRKQPFWRQAAQFFALYMGAAVMAIVGRFA